MANDAFDNSRTDREMHDHLTPRIDLDVTPGTVAVYLNHPALVDLITKLETVRNLSVSSTSICITFRKARRGTWVTIGTDDASTPS